MSFSNVSLSAFSLDQDSSMLYWGGLAVGIGAVSLVTRVCLSRLGSSSERPAARPVRSAAEVRAAAAPATPAARSAPEERAAAAPAARPVRSAAEVRDRGRKTPGGRLLNASAETVTAILRDMGEVIRRSQEHCNILDVLQAHTDDLNSDLVSLFTNISVACGQMPRRIGTLGSLLQNNYEEAAGRTVQLLNNSVAQGSRASTEFNGKLDLANRRITEFQDRLPERVNARSSTLEKELAKPTKDSERIAFLTAEVVKGKLTELRQNLQDFQDFWVDRTITLENYEEIGSACADLKRFCDAVRGSIQDIRRLRDGESSADLAAALRAYRDGEG